MQKKMTTLYKYITEEHAAEIIKSSRLRMGDGSNFNDPFELMVVDKKKKNMQPISGVRILCLTNSRSMKLMWSHYSNSHKGLCLAVSVPSEQVYHVCYTGKRVDADSNVDTIMSMCENKGRKNLIKPYVDLPHKHKIALIKDQKWNYEKEYRIVCDEKNLDASPEDGKYYFPVQIERVYLGCRFNENSHEVIEAIMQACRKRNIDVKQMCLSYSNYSLEVKDLPDDGGPHKYKSAALAALG